MAAGTAALLAGLESDRIAGHLEAWRASAMRAPRDEAVWCRRWGRAERRPARSSISVSPAAERVKPARRAAEARPGRAHVPESASSFTRKVGVLVGWSQTRSPATASTPPKISSRLPATVTRATGRTGFPFSIHSP